MEEQLLGKVISKEQKALEEQLTQVLEEVNSNTKSLMLLDASLLERLKFAPPTPPTSNDANRGHSARGGNDNQDGAGDEYNIVNGFG